MEGNFRIAQLSELEFVIEKEYFTTIKYPWYKFKKDEKIAQWCKVDQLGNFARLYNLQGGGQIGHYKTSDLKVAQERLKRIKKYPIFFSE